MLNFDYGANFGTDGAQSLALIDVVDDMAELELWQELTEVTDFDRQSMRLEIKADSRGSVLRAHLRSASGDRRDVYMPGGDQDRILPTDGPPIGLANTVWNVWSVETPSESYEGLLIGGGLAPHQLRKLAWTTSRDVAEFRAEQ